MTSASLTGVHLLGWGLSDPVPIRVISGRTYQFDVGVRGALAESGGDIFDSSVTELRASTGALVEVISGWNYQFNGPDAMVVSGNDLFANGDGASVTQLPA